MHYSNRNYKNNQDYFLENLLFREATLEDLDRCYEIETISYGGDEAATKEKIAKRIETYPKGFLVLEKDKELVGFINSGACFKVSLSDEEFKELIGHDENGDKIVIMSVVVHPTHQRNGYAKLLMNQFIKNMKIENKKEIHLICQTHLIEMYKSFGFEYICESDSSHGGLSWHDMILYLDKI